MLPDRVSNPGPLTYESGALPIALRGPARFMSPKGQGHYLTFDPGLSKYDSFKHLDSQKPLG